MSLLYYNENGQLCFESQIIHELCAQQETPFYIYSSKEIQNNCRQIARLSTGINLLPCYALKANYNPEIIKIAKQEGMGADVVSGGELHFALKCGIPPKRIVFAGVGKTESEITTAIQTGIHSLNIESVSELELVAKITNKLKKKITLAIRINPDIDANTHPYISTGLHENKFGVDPETAFRLYEFAQHTPYLDPAGIHIHIGSQIQTAKPYLESATFILEFMDRLERNDIHIRFIDLGGGIGIQYDNLLDEAGSEKTLIAEILPKVLKTLNGIDREIIIELGRAIVGSAGLLISKILYKKETPNKKFIIVDAGMNNLIRPSLYNAYHQILPVMRKNNPPELVDVVGPVCETGDYFAKDREINTMDEGECIAITGTGAYGQVLSSNYNLRPRIPEYLVEDNSLRKIYDGETIDFLCKQYSW